MKNVIDDFDTKIQCEEIEEMNEGALDYLGKLIDEPWDIIDPMENINIDELYEMGCVPNVDF